MTHSPDAAQKIEAFNAAHGLQGAAHQTVISYLFIEPPRPIIEGAESSRGWAKLTCKQVYAVSEYQAAISDMLDRDLLWEIDETKLKLISDHLNAAPARGPTEGMPEIGTLQISIRFANMLDELWASITTERPGAIWSRDWQTDKLSLIYSPTRKGCFDFLRDELADEDYSTDIEWLSGPQACGPWRCYWWRKYESGYVLEVHYA
jgi:hypothetical protein